MTSCLFIDPQCFSLRFAGIVTLLQFFITGRASLLACRSLLGLVRTLSLTLPANESSDARLLSGLFIHSAKE